MFKKFTPKDISSTVALKSSAQRGVRKTVVEEAPEMEEFVDDLLPSGSIQEARCKVSGEKINLIVVERTPLFFKTKDSPFVPLLRTLHKYPRMLKGVRVDRGGIKFLMSGANLMCPGLTSKGGFFPDDLEVDDIVAIFAEGKELPLAVGQVKMSSEAIAKENSGVAINILHVLGDGLWRCESL